MYTVPATTTIQTKQLIANFEKGELPVATNGDASNSLFLGGGNSTGGVRVNRELSVEELAQPGTAKRLLQEFEARARQSSKVEVVVRSSVHRGDATTTTTIKNRLSTGTPLTETVTIQPVVNGVPAAEIAAVEVVIAAEEPIHGQAREEAIHHATDHLVDLQVTNEPAVQLDILSEPIIEVVACNASSEEILGGQPDEEAVYQTLNADQQRIESAVNTLDEAIDSGERRTLHAVELEEHVEEVHIIEPLHLEANKNVLIVHAIRDRVSLHDALVEKTTQLVESTKHSSVTATDLTKFAASTSSAAEAEEERHKVAASDLLIMVYQPLFNSVPSSLQAWIEAVFLSDQHADKTLFSNKKVMVLLTTPNRKEDFDASSDHGDLSAYLHPPQVQVLRQLGFDALEPHAIFGTSDEGNAEEILSHWATRLASAIE